MTPDDRIKLAEAMGLDLTIEWQDAAGHWHESERDFDPFTDANDDVACNEWAIKNLDPDAYFAALSEIVGSYCYMHEYCTGYFSQAVLKVLEHD